MEINNMWNDDCLIDKQLRENLKHRNYYTMKINQKAPLKWVEVI